MAAVSSIRSAPGLQPLAAGATLYLDVVGRSCPGVFRIDYVRQRQARPRGELITMDMSAMLGPPARELQQLPSGVACRRIMTFAQGEGFAGSFLFQPSRSRRATCDKRGVGALHTWPLARLAICGAASEDAARMWPI
jgi:hypothetical protein